jgi:hypothetical protein
MWTSLVEAVRNFFGSIPIIDRWVTRTPSEKIAARQREVAEKTEAFKKTGRPW